MTSDPLDRYKSKVVQGTENDLENKDLPFLDAETEYTFRLDKRHLKCNVAGFKPGSIIDKLFTLWLEEKTGNLLMQGFRIDVVSHNADDPTYQSPVVTFFQKIGLPLDPAKTPNWGNLFIVGMRIKARVLPVLDKDGKPTGVYRLDLASVRRFMEA